MNNNYETIEYEMNNNYETIEYEMNNNYETIESINNRYWTNNFCRTCGMIHACCPLVEKFGGTPVGMDEYCTFNVYKLTKRYK